MDLPHSIGPYRIQGLLGYGGIGMVLLAIAHGASGFEKKVAIKTLLPELQGDGDCERMLVEEALLAARFQHRNLIGVHELGVSKGTCWVRMDHVDGRDLATMIDAARMPVPLALFIAEELALALCYLHALRDAQGRPLGLVHRDVTPSNVMLSRAGEVKLGDFGIAKATLLAEVTRAGVRKGKHAYMSPEQVTGSVLSGASDQFSLGITLAEMLTGSRPYDAESPLLTMENIREAKPPALNGVEEDIATIVRRCLVREPAGRYEATEELYEALAEARRVRGATGPLTLGAWVRERG